MLLNFIVVFFSKADIRIIYLHDIHSQAVSFAEEFEGI